jgi:hypothetical protein
MLFLIPTYKNTFKSDSFRVTEKNILLESGLKIKK